MADNDGYIKARFFVTKKAVTIYARYKSVTCTLRWDRTGDPEEQTRHLKTLIGNLDQLVSDGLQEVVIQAEAAQIDQEWLEMDEPPPAEETP